MPTIELLKSRHVYGAERVPVLDADEAAEFDRASREHFGIPERVLMENAGRAVAGVIARAFERGRVLAVAGSGHNGGDALVALRVLKSWGWEVAWVQAGGSPPDPALLHGWDIDRIEAPDDGAFAAADVIIDGLLGTGSRGAPRERAAAVIEQMNASGRPIAAVDLPSGVDPTTGRVPGVAVRAWVTVTFGAPKTGLMLQPARSYCGWLACAEIGFAPVADSRTLLITPEYAYQRMPRRSPDSHKGQSGRLLLLAGSTGMAGAAAISGLAAVRSGAGLVRIVSTESNRTIVQSVVPEATFFTRGDLDAAEGVTAMAAGPGLGTTDESWSVLNAYLDATGDRPVVLDADALNLHAVHRNALRARAAARPVVLTPHVRELARLTGSEDAAILSDPLRAAREFAGETGAIVLLKGQPSVIASPDGTLLINTLGSSDTAVAGMGDQLTGTIAGMLAAGLDARDAAAVGLFFSGRAADLAGLGRSLSPRDVSLNLSRAFRSPGRRTPMLDLPFITFEQPPRW